MKPLSCTTDYLEFLTQTSKQVHIDCRASLMQVCRFELSQSPSLSDHWGTVRDSLNS